MRKEEILERSRQMIEEGEKPSVETLARELEYHPASVHRLLNALEKEDRVETYAREILGEKVRMVAVKRE
ncbi:MAG: helix-turn-helix domain-containing protein [Candidatus Nanohaloarchaea archaeon]